MNNLIIRTITGLLFVTIIVCSFFYAISMVFIFALITGMTIWEFTGLVNAQKETHTNRFICTVAGVYFFFAFSGFCSELTPSTVFIPYLLAVVYIFIHQLYMKGTQPINNWAYSMLSQMYIALPFSLINVLSFHSIQDTNKITYTYIVPLSIFIFLWCNDSGAYCTGSLIGKHKLFPRISPGKTWEGSIGGALLVIIVAAIIGYFTDLYGMNNLQLSIPQWIGLGLVIVIFGTWGDLVESLFKRTLGIKDSGSILPGHGGMLDRFDSSLLAIPAAVVYLYTLTLF